MRSNWPYISSYIVLERATALISRQWKDPGRLLGLHPLNIEPRSRWLLEGAWMNYILGFFLIVLGFFIKKNLWNVFKFTYQFEKQNKEVMVLGTVYQFNVEN